MAGMDFKRLGIGNSILLVLNLLAIIVGLGLCVTNGPSGPLVLLTGGAIGMAIRKLLILFGPENDCSE